MTIRGKRTTGNFVVLFLFFMMAVWGVVVGRDRAGRVRRGNVRVRGSKWIIAATTIKLSGLG